MHAVAQAQPNIALVKYWGKRDVETNLPAEGSLSITLDRLWTRMSVSFEADEEDSLLVNGEPSPAMLERVSRCLDHVAGADRRPARVESESNFPIGAGLASSASAFAALVVAADAAAGCNRDMQSLSRLAGRSSGSAARSLFGGFVELSAGDEAIDVRVISDCDDWPMEVVIAVTESREKHLGSGEAMMRSAATSPFYADWLARQQSDLEAARQAVADRDFEKLANVSEHNCLKMHSVMWTSRPPIVYWNRTTIACMETIRSLKEEGDPVFFTIDAGPQVKAVCLPESADLVLGALRQTPGVIDVIRTGLGAGAHLVSA